MSKFRGPFYAVSLAILFVAGCRWLRAGAQPPPPLGCAVFPADNIWNAPVDRLPLDPMSDTYIETISGTRGLHPDFSAGGGGIPYNVVPATQSKVAVKLESSESDRGSYPIPADPVLEPGPDAHLIVVQQGECKLYEIYAAKKRPDGSWQGSLGAIFDLRSNGLRQSGWSSADAAGLPILPGLVRYDEVNAGEIRHALRFTAPKTRKDFIWPGRHYASGLTDKKYPPLGERFRLKASFDTSGFAPEVQIMLKAMKKYGMILADNGSAWYFTGAPDPRWSDSTIVPQFRKVHGSDFEAVDVSSLMVSPNSGQAAAGGPALPPSSTPVSSSGGGSSNIVQKFVLQSDMTGPSISNLPDGQQVTFLICQDAKGGRKFSWPSNTRGGMQVGQSPGKCSVQQFIVDAGTLYAASPGKADQ
jgi:hypothetical protein